MTATRATTRTAGGTTSAAPAGRALAHLPVTLFSAVMGLGGIALAWRRAAPVWGVPEWPFLAFLAGQADWPGYDVIAVALLTLATTVALAVTVLTLRAAARGQLCVPEA